MLRNVLRIARGALLMGAVWAFAWGGVIGGSIELAANIIPDLAFAKLADIWLFDLGIPGFIAGALFSVLLSATERSRRFEELSLERFAALGALAGLGLTAFMAALGLGASSLSGLLARALIVSIPVTALSAVTSSGVLMLARLRGKSPERLGVPTT